MRKKSLPLLTLALLSMSTTSWAQSPGPQKASAAIPYHESFDAQKNFNTFMVIDSNNDGATWVWRNDDNPYARCNSGDNGKDDWLLTPLLHLEGNRSYVLSFKYYNGYYPEQMSVAFGLGDDPSAYQTIVADMAVNVDEFTSYTTEFTPTTTGDYRIGFHATTQDNNFYLGIDDIDVTAGAQTAAPDSVTNLKLTRAPKGARDVSLSFVAPTNDATGNALSALTKIEVTRNDTLVQSFSEPQPGQALQCRLKGGMPGINKFSVTAFSSTGEGRKATRNVYFGIDVPQPPTSFKLTDNGKTYTATWEAVDTIGANGGYVDPDKVTYTLYDFAEDEINSGIEDTEYVDDDAHPENVTGVMQYYLAAKSTAGLSAKAASNYVCTGKPARLPFAESFVKGSTADGNLWWWQFDTQKNWRATSDLSYDNDGGCLRFAGESKGDEGWLSSGKISLKNEKDPYLSLAYYAYPGADNRIELIISKMQNEDAVVQTIDFSTLQGEEGWRKVLVPVTGMDKADFVVLRLHAIINDINKPAIVDNIQLKSLKQNDLSVGFDNTPDALVVGKESSFGVKVSNEGSETSGEYTVNLYCNGKLAATQNGGNLLPQQDAVTQLSFVPDVFTPEQSAVYAEVVYDADEVPGNNTTRKDTLLTAHYDYLPNTQLTGTVDGTKVVLSWNPVVQPTEVTEDFENYPDWRISYLGPWTLVDGDQAYTYGINGVSFPHWGDAMAYMVFNPTAAGLDLTQDPEIAPHSGDKFLCCMAADPEFVASGHNDDWLISPALNGKSQTATLWAKSLFAGDNNGLLEHFEVLGSTTGQATSDFTQKLLDADKVPDSWTQYSVSIPEGVRYFAIHTISADKFMLMLDDIYYQPDTIKVAGYRIYRDSTLLATVAPTQFSYTDNEADGESHNYQITTVYESGESNASHPYTVSTGLNGILAQAPLVGSGKGFVVVDNAAGQHVELYALGGTRVYAGIGNSRIHVPAGIYIIKVGNRSSKIIVK